MILAISCKKTIASTNYPFGAKLYQIYAFLLIKLFFRILSWVIEL